MHKPTLFNPRPQKSNLLDKFKDRLVRSGDDWFGPDWQSCSPIEISWEENLTQCGDMVDHLLSLINDHQIENINGVQWLYLWFAFEQQQPRCLGCAEALIRGFWDIGIHREQTLLFWLIRHVVSLLQSSNISSHSSNSNIEKDNVSCSLIDWHALFMKYSGKAIHALTQGDYRGVKFLQEILPPSFLLWEESSRKEIASRFIQYCQNQKARKKINPKDVLRQLAFPEEGKLVQDAHSCCKEHLYTMSWDSLKIKWYLHCLQSFPKKEYYSVLNEILEKVDDNRLGNSKGSFFKSIIDELGHPDSRYSDWADASFSEQARHRVRLYGGGSRYEDYEKVKEHLGKKRYFERLDHERRDLYGDQTRMESRYTFWRKYKHAMVFVKFFLGWSAYDVLKQDVEGVTLLREKGLGVYLGRGKSQMESDICVMLFENVLIIEFLYGRENNALFVERRVYENHKEVFLSSELHHLSIMNLPIIHRQGHPHLWMDECTEALEGYGIYKRFR